jgi:DNA-binding SARP family transcriptional activator/ABC-type branched-subunit amino acid transport system substrate-binding protein/DNA-binding beta-propeller fold protein YncE
MAATSVMEFRILGPLDVVEDGRSIDLGGPKQRALLAALLLRGDEVVSQDILIDDLWGEAPPATAAKTLQAYVSRLRKALADENGARLTVRLETRGHGYVLRIPPGSLDAGAFERGLAEGRQALARDDARRAADLLRKALDLWRGQALADLAYEPFAQPEIARLEELRLTALEERIDADLALGRSDELIGELESLVQGYPLRERLRGQLMLALYRSGRQAEALRVYQDGRQHLAAELGLEPGESLRRLERQIFEQDAALGAASRRTRPTIVPASAWRHPVRIAVAGAVVLAVAVGFGAWRLAGDEDQQATAGAIALDPHTGGVRKTISFGTSPSSVAVGEGSVWVLDGDDQTVTQIDPETNKVVRVFGTSSRPTDIGAGAGAVWVGNGGSDDLDEMPQSVSRIDPASGVVVDTIDLPPPPGGNISGIGGFSRQKIAVTPEAVWVINPDQSISRIDPLTNRVVARVEARAQVIAAGEGDVWIGQEGGIAEVDTARNVVSRHISLRGDTPSGLAVGAGSLWAADPLDGSIWRIPRDRPAGKRRIPLTRWVNVVAFGAGSVWATNEIADEVYRLDPRTNAVRVVTRTPSPRGVGADGGGVWVVAASPPSRNAALPSPACSAIFSNDGDLPRILLVSDLPLHGEGRPIAQAIVDGVRHVLQQRGFEAGGYSVGFQSCDSSTAQSGGSDFFRCGSMAKAYARNLRVVGIVGSFASPCSYVQIPVTNQAAEGPLAMLSPSNTYQGLTEDEELYPTGVRNYARIAGADHLQAVAHAELAKRLGARRVVVLSPLGESPYPRFARDVRIAGRQLGMDVVSLRYDPEATDFTPFARSVAQARPDAIVLADILYPGSAAVIRAARAAVGPRTAILAPDGFAGLYDDLVKLAGSAAKGMYVSQYGIANERLPPRGRQFLKSFASGRQTGAGPDYGAAYGAQAAEILLDAIARSDGTRASVTREVFRTRIRDGILGDIRFDRNGDLVDSPFTFVRMVGDPDIKPGLRPELERVVVARSALLRQTR